MTWAMIDGWREDFNEGPHDYLAVRDSWEIFQRCAGDRFRLTCEDVFRGHFETAKAAKEFAYKNGCSRPRKSKP